MLLQTWMTLNSKEDILKNVDNQTIVIPIDFHSIFQSQWVEVNSQDLLCSTEETQTGLEWVFIFGSLLSL